GWLRIKSIHTLLMANRPTKRKRKVPMLKVDEMQKTSNESVNAITSSFEGTTKGYASNHSRNCGLHETLIRAWREDDGKISRCQVAGQGVRGADRIRQGRLRKLRELRYEPVSTLRRLG